MKKEKSPFRGFTLSQINSIEADTYVIQVGVDLFCYKGQFFFTKRSAALLYNKILVNLVDLINNGDTEQKNDATKCLGNLRILPLRIN